MALKTDSVIVATMKYLTPKKGFWVKRTSVLTCFILLDYLVTVIFCTAPAQEGNLLARSFMEAYGIPLGLTLFDSVANLPIYIILCLDSHLINLPARSSRIAEVFTDAIFAWFIAGLHFNGATSWVWFAPNIARQAVGASAYLLIVFSWHRRKSKIRPCQSA
jgi:hypothetical protein